MLSVRFLSKKFALLIAMMCLALFVVGCGSSGSKALQVKDVQNDPFSYTGEITVVGIVSDFATDGEPIFGIKDIESMKQCGFSITCSAWVMPVVLEGQGGLPAFADEVEVTGTFANMDGHPVFQATDYKVTGSYAEYMQ